MGSILTPKFNDRRDAFSSVFGASKFHSEQDRQELIGKKAKSIGQYIAASLMKNDAEALEIAGDLFGCMEPETGAKILRLMLNPQAVQAGRELILAEMGKTIANTAEHRAIKLVESE